MTRIENYSKKPPVTTTTQKERQKNMSTQQSPGLSTLALRAGYRNEPSTNACAAPIYLTAAFNFNSSAHAANLFGLKEFGNIYARLTNPTTDVLEQRLAALHNAAGAVAFSSGQAAITAAILNITGAGQNIVASKSLYGGTVNLFAVTLKRLGITVKFVNLQDSAALEAAIDDNTRLVYTETLGNPSNNVDDYEEIARIAHAHGLPVVTDNTVAPPAWFNPFKHGADIAIYSLTKFISGHGTALGGAIVEKGDFPWNNGKFPEITEPDESYHGLSYWAAFGKHDEAVAPGVAFVIKARAQILRDMGACLSPLNAFQIMQGLETLQIRLAAHAKNAQAVAEWLEKHPLVTWVNYPGLASHKDHERAVHYFKNGFGGIIGFGIKGGKEAGVKFIDSVKLFSHLANIGDAKSLVIHPASTTHQQLSPEQRKAAGVSDEFVRLSIGIEDIQDLLADLDQALTASQN